MRWKRLEALTIATALLFTTAVTEKTVAAYASSDTGTATLKVLATSDIHGQSVRLNYDSDSLASGSLAQLGTLIREERASMKGRAGTTVTVDSGDVVYGLAAERIITGKVTGAQYMYAGMNAIGYDAITMGNHDFDFGIPYIQKALKETGLDKKVVLSNVVDARTKKNLFAPGRIIKKQIKTTSGKKHTLKIGFVGAVVPSITSMGDGMDITTNQSSVSLHSFESNRKWNYVVQSKDIVDSVRPQAKTLKKKGADIVIAVVHSGIGGQKHKNRDNNQAYVLASIPEIDCVCSGHAHMNYPSDDANAQTYYTYANTSSDGLMYGKPVLQEKDHGDALGVATLKIGYENGKAYVVDSSAKVRKVTEDTPEDPAVMSVNDTYNTQMQDFYSQAVSDKASDADGYFGMIEDNPLVELNNKALIRYGLREQQKLDNTDEKYRNVPVIAATAYKMGGQVSSSNYINVKGSLDTGDILNASPFYESRAKIYYITGRMLREMLEWDARIFQTTGMEKNTSWDQETQTLVDQGYRPVLNPAHQDGWDNFIVYDGIEYTIDPSGSSRYSEDGQLHEENHRIKSLTCNGKEISDSDGFLLITKNPDRNYIPPSFNTKNDEKYLKAKDEHLSSLLEEYITEQTQNGQITLESDHNWKVVFPEGENYLIRSSQQASDLAKTRDWYSGELQLSKGYSFYQAKFDTELETVDRSAPCIVASPAEKGTTGSPEKIYVQVNDTSGLSTVKYVAGAVGVDYDGWNDAATVSGDGFEAAGNGIYTVYACDNNGNATVSYVNVTNIKDGASTAPRIDGGKVTNIQTTVSGKASAGADIRLSGADGSIYTAKADDKGAFRIVLDAPFNADTSIAVSQTDANGHPSEERQYTVQRSGANMPTVTQITNTSTQIRGKLNDESYCRIMAVSGNTVYYPKGAESQLAGVKAYKQARTKKACTYSESDGSFALTIPVPAAGTEYTIYGVDWIGKAGVQVNMKALDVAPELPVFSAVVAQEGLVCGHVPSPDDSYVISVTNQAGQTVTGSAATDGYFAIETGDLKSGQKVSVSASDEKDGHIRTSATATATISTNTSEVLADRYSGVSFIDPVNDEQTSIRGEVDISPLREDYEYRLMIGSRHADIMPSADGSFTYDLPDPLKAGTVVGLIVRNQRRQLVGLDYVEVEETVPRRPVLRTRNVTEDTKTIKITSNRNCQAILRCGSVMVQRKKASSHSARGYEYSLSVPARLRKKGKKLTIYLENSAGESGKITVKVKKGRTKKK